MNRTAFIDVGDPGAPVGSPAWCKYAHGILCSSKRRTDAEVSSLKYSLIEFRDLERWKQLADNDGRMFASWEDYLQYPEPNGLGMSPASAKLVIDELDDSRLLGDVLGKRGRPKKGQGKGDNVTFSSRGNNRAYTLARLDRDGHAELAVQVRAKKMSASAAAEQVGYRKPPSPLKQLRKAWAKASDEDRAQFLAEVTARKAVA